MEIQKHELMKTLVGEEWPKSVHMNTNFANGPSINGTKFVFPDEGFEIFPGLIDLFYQLIYLVTAYTSLWLAMTNIRGQTDRKVDKLLLLSYR